MFGWFKRKAKPEAKRRMVDADHQMVVTKEMADRIKEYEAKGYENLGPITLSGGQKATIMATPGEYVKRKDEGDQ